MIPEDWDVVLLGKDAVAKRGSGHTLKSHEQVEMEVSLDINLVKNSIHSKTHPTDWLALPTDTAEKSVRYLRFRKDKIVQMGQSWYHAALEQERNHDKDDMALRVSIP